jgi:hypothetical protein
MAPGALQPETVIIVSEQAANLVARLLATGTDEGSNDSARQNFRA